jgi:hypothetical protein
MRPLDPVPVTSSSGTPSSRANLRTDGEACGSVPFAAAGWWSGIGAGTDADGTAGGCACSAPGAAGVATGAAGGAVAAPAAPSRTAIGEPCETLSPSLTFSSLTTPACDEGISIDALSLSTVIRLCSTWIASPGLTKISITATSRKSPMSGTNTSTRPAAGVGAETAGALARSAGIAAGASRGAAAAPCVSSSSTTDPSLTLSPSATFISLTTPGCDEGISIDALSDSTVISDCSALMVSPGLTSTSMTATSLKSPMSGTFTSTTAISRLR